MVLKKGKPKKVKSHDHQLKEYKQKHKKKQKEVVKNDNDHNHTNNHHQVVHQTVNVIVGSKSHKHKHHAEHDHNHVNGHPPVIVFNPNLSVPNYGAYTNREPTNKPFIDTSLLNYDYGQTFPRPGPSGPAGSSIQPQEITGEYVGGRVHPRPPPHSHPQPEQPGVLDHIGRDLRFIGGSALTGALGGAAIGFMGGGPAGAVAGALAGAETGAIESTVLTAGSELGDAIGGATGASIGSTVGAVAGGALINRRYNVANAAISSGIPQRVNNALNDAGQRVRTAMTGLRTRFGGSRLGGRGDGYSRLAQGDLLDHGGSGTAEAFSIRSPADLPFSSPQHSTSLRQRTPGSLRPMPRSAHLSGISTPDLDLEAGAAGAAGGSPHRLQPLPQPLSQPFSIHQEPQSRQSMLSTASTQQGDEFSFQLGMQMGEERDKHVARLKRQHRGLEKLKATAQTMEEKGELSTKQQHIQNELNSLEAKYKPRGSKKDS